MSIALSIKKGLDIHLEGGITSRVINIITSPTVAITPNDFPGLIPKLEIKEGESVKVGTPVLRDKNQELIKLVSPVSGVVKQIVRGERRKIERVVIENDGKDDAVTFDNSSLSERSDICAFLFKTGLWAYMRQRPYDIVPSIDDAPRDIFVTAFDTAPLSPDLELMINGKEKELNAGIAMLKALTDGKVYLSVRKGTDTTAIVGADIVEVSGPHPAGNAGIQAANIAPVNKGETIWTLDVVTLVKMGYVALTRQLDNTTIIAVTGSEIEHPQYIKTVIGASIASLISGNIKADGHNHRIISGNVLTGHAVGEAGFLRFPYWQVTAIPEGDDVNEFMGWASLSLGKMSVNRSFPAHFLRKKRFAPDARILGGRRAMILSGEYEKVLPMDIMAEYLIKAIISRDIDKMENLGIYEVAPADFALCEYVDASKLELQKIVRDGLDYLHKELE